MILVTLFTILLLNCLKATISTDPEITQTVPRSQFPSTRNVTDAVCFKIECRPAQVNLTLAPGAIEEIHLTVQNLGNGSDHIRLGSPDDQFLEDAGIYYQGLDELTLVPGNNSVVIPVQISAGKKADTQEIDFELRVISNGALAEGNLTVYSTVEVHLVIDNGDDENYIKENWLTFVMIGVIFMVVFLFLVILLKRLRERKSS